MPASKDFGTESGCRTSGEPTRAGAGQDVRVTTEDDYGVVFPIGENGRRRTSAFGRAVVADALRPVDPLGARAAEQETAWRSGYLVHFRRLVEAGLGSRADAVAIASAGLSTAHERMRVLGDDVQERSLADWPRSRTELATAEVSGDGERETELSVPYHGQRLRGDDLRRRLDAWVGDGVVEPTAAEAVAAVLARPDWLRLDGHTVAVLGAGAEMGPLPSLLRWGARVAALDLARPAIWARVLRLGHEGAGTVLVPHTPGGAGHLERSAGVDLIADVPVVVDWLTDDNRRLVVGNYVYADGATNVRVSMAVDELSRRLLERREDVALAFLATPTDVFAVPADAVAHSTRAYEHRSARAKLLGRPLRTLSGGRLLRRS